MALDKDAATAVIDDGNIVIRLPLANLQTIMDGGFACNAYEARYKVLDQAGAGKDICSALNDEDEDGTTPIHRLFDAAINEALNQGSEFFEEHEDQEIPGPDMPDED